MSLGGARSASSGMMPEWPDLQELEDDSVREKLPEIRYFECKVDVPDAIVQGPVSVQRFERSSSTSRVDSRIENKMFIARDSLGHSRPVIMSSTGRV